MHKYMRAIGFSGKSRKEIRDLVFDSIRNSDSRGYSMGEDDILLGEFSRDYAEGLGITAAGIFDEEDKFNLEYFYPYLKGRGISSVEDVSVERHASQDSYAGVCDDLKVGISLIFYLQNKIPYINAKVSGRLPVRGTTLTLSALSIKGTVLLPIHKDPDDVERVKQKADQRVKLLAKAKSGDENAIEMLTLEDMDLYTSISKRILKEDVYSMVDTSLMPYGVECDQYSIVGEILEVRQVENHITAERIYILTLLCNELTFDMAINIMDLVGEPQPGRRFKGTIWLQGSINYPEEL